MTPWQDIESAPKDGTRFLAAIHHGQFGYMVVCARRVGPTVQDTAEGSCVGWRPGSKHAAFWTSLPTPPVEGEDGLSGADIARTGTLPVLTDGPCQSEELARVCNLLVTYGGIVATAYTPDDMPDRIRLTSGEVIEGEVAEVLLDMARTVTELARLAQSALSSEPRS